MERPHSLHGIYWKTKDIPNQRNNVILFKKETKKKNSALLTLQGMCVE